MVKVINCSRCGKFFESDGWMMLCMECMEQDEKVFRRIRDYLYEKPGAKIFEVSIDLDISVGKIKQYLKEGRLQILEKNNIFLKCERCGKSICSGLYCDECARTACHEFKTAFVGNSGVSKKATQVMYNKRKGK